MLIENICKPESIPVGCVPPACRLYPIVSHVCWWMDMPWTYPPPDIPTLRHTHPLDFYQPQIYPPQTNPPLPQKGPIIKDTHPPQWTKRPVKTLPSSNFVGEL